MNPADIIKLLEAIPKETLLKALIGNQLETKSKSSKPVMVEREVEYHNICKLCGRSWISTSPANFMTYSDTTKPINRVFSNCDKCETVLMTKPKEEIIRRALDIIQDKHITGGTRKW